MSKQAQVWPKTYLLQIYSRAVAEGCVRIPLQNEQQFKSLSQALYRVRRRSDAQHASFILPEYHLVFCSWEPERGTMLVTYDALPDGMELPPVLSVDEIGERRPAAKKPEFVPKAEEVDHDQLLSDIISAAAKKVVDDSGDM